MKRVQACSTDANYQVAGHAPHAVLRCRYEISRRPEVEAKVAAELDQAGLLAKPGRPHPRALEFDDLARLPYLSWACKVRNSCLCMCTLALCFLEPVQRMHATPEACG